MTIQKADPTDPYPPKVMQELRANFLRVQAPVSAGRLWEQVLTPSERERLGEKLEMAYSHGRTVGMWMRLRGVSQPRAIVDLAFELNFITPSTRKWLLREIGDAPETIEAAIENAVASGALVLVEQERTAFWKGQPIEIDWRRRPALWNYFWTLCESAKHGRGVDHMDFGERRQPSYASKLKNKLSQLPEFPLDLIDLILPGGRGSQRLNLPPECLRLFSVQTIESLREVIG